MLDQHHQYFLTHASALVDVWLGYLAVMNDGCAFKENQIPAQTGFGGCSVALKNEQNLSSTVTQPKSFIVPDPGSLARAQILFVCFDIHTLHQM